MKKYIMPAISVVTVMVVALLIILQDKQPLPTTSPQIPLSGLALKDKVNQLTASGKYDEARKFLDGNTSKEGKMLTAQILMSEKKFKEALATYQEIEQEHGENKQTASAAAQAADAAGDRATAISYYQKVIDYTKGETNNPVRDAEIKLLQASIDRLKKDD